MDARRGGLDGPTQSVGWPGVSCSVSCETADNSSFPTKREGLVKERKGEKETASWDCVACI